jgi:ribosomal-protein-alanine N-acetyltransferase
VTEPAVGPDRSVTLVPLPAHRTDRALTGDFTGLSVEGLRAGRGWPHDDTAHALAFTHAGGQTWLVVDDVGAVIGELGTKGPPSPDGRVEIGYGLAAASRGRGLGTAAVRLLVEALRRQPHISVLEADVVLDNLASQRLLERLGFRYVSRDHGELHYELRLAEEG